MAQILIIESDETLRKIIKLNLMKTTDCDVIEMKSAKEAIDLLRILPEMELIICREVMPKDQAGLMLSSFLINENLKTPLLIIGNKVSEYEHLFVIDGKAEWKEIVAKVASIRSVEPERNVEVANLATEPEYAAVSIDYFMNITSLNSGCDVFIRVKKDENKFQYVKRLHGGDHFSREDILRYHKDGLSEFYIIKDQLSEFINYATKGVLSKLSDSSIAGSQKITIASDAYKITQERIYSIGVDELTVQLVEESILAMTSLLKEQNNLAMLLKSLRANECSYAYAHSYLCCLILHKIITQFDWQSPQIRDKLAYIAYFHDISLCDGTLSEINNQEDLNRSLLNDEDSKKVNHHALESSKIVEKFDKIPQGIGAIIKEHHGSKTGVGFVDSFSSTLMPLSMMFIVTENFVEEILKIEGSATGPELKNIFSKLQLKFNKSTYEQTLNALQEMAFGKKS